MATLTRMPAALRAFDHASATAATSAVDLRSHLQDVNSSSPTTSA